MQALSDAFFPCLQRLAEGRIGKYLELSKVGAPAELAQPRQSAHLLRGGRVGRGERELKSQQALRRNSMSSDPSTKAQERAWRIPGRIGSVVGFIGLVAVISSIFLAGLGVAGQLIWMGGLAMCLLGAFTVSFSLLVQATNKSPRAAGDPDA